MGTVADKVRELVGEGETLRAIEVLEQHLKGRNTDLYNQVIHQKGQFNTYRKQSNLGMGADPAVAAKINYAILEIATSIEKGEDQSWQPTGGQSGGGNSGIQQDTSHNQPAEYTAQCFFYNDPNQYWVNRYNQIIAYNPVTNLNMPIAQRVPSNDPRFAWLYYFNTGMFYSIDHQGAIWGQNMFGMPMQMGYVKYL